MRKTTFTAFIAASVLGLTACSAPGTPGAGLPAGSGKPQILSTSLGQGRIEVTTNVAASCVFSFKKNGADSSVTLTQVQGTGNKYSAPLASATYSNAKLSCSNSAGTTVDGTYNGGNITIKV